ncbi:MAG: tetratricopeptide repeat protein, partial [Alphaproteobacteria bacterium]|nr:tetratricopeptide repeat protein [Alphaproteobacteria bacterium]
MIKKGRGSCKGLALFACGGPQKTSICVDESNGQFDTVLTDWNIMLLRTVSWIFASLLATQTALAAVDAQTTFSGNYLAGRLAGRMRDNDAAAAFLAAALKQEPGNPILVERLFQSQLAMGHVADAEALAPSVIANNSQQRMAHIVLGLKQYSNRRYPEARVQFAQAAYTPVGELTSTLLNAWTYAGEGSLNAALKELDKLDGQDAYASYKAFHAALIADFLKSSIRADVSYKKAYDLAGNSLRVTQAYANFLARAGRIEDAKKIYQKFLSGGQHNVIVESDLAMLDSGKVPAPFISLPAQGAAEVLFSLAAAMNSDQSVDAALMYAQLAMSLNPAEPVMRSLVGDIYTDMKNGQSAIDTYEGVPTGSPLRNYADTQIAVNLQRDGKDKEATARLQIVVGRDPKNVDALIALGGLYRNASDFQKAVDTYSQAIALQGDDNVKWQLYYFRGIAFDRKKDFDKSEADFRKALSLSKDEPSVLNYLGYSMIDRGEKLDEAIAMVKKAVELKPNDGYIVDSLGWAYFTMGDYDQAVNYLER